MQLQMGLLEVIPTHLKNLPGLAQFSLVNGQPTDIQVEPVYSANGEIESLRPVTTADSNRLEEVTGATIMSVRKLAKLIPLLRLKMSLFPKSYLLALTKTIEFDDIFNITRAWDLDSFIGVFDKTGKTMFVFSQKYGLVHVSFDPSNVPAEFDEVSKLFDNAGFVNSAVGRGGNRDRIEEYYKTVVNPFI